jgi:hypothetical protein
LDCCHSGAFAEGIKGPATAVNEGTFSAGDGAEGQYVLMATNALQYAFDAAEKAPADTLSRFTSWLVDGLAKGEAAPSKSEITLDDVFDYLCRRSRAAGSPMTPQRFIRRNSGDLVIARNPLVRAPVVPSEAPASDGAVERAILDATARVEARFSAAPELNPKELPRLATPIRRSARELISFSIVDELLARSEQGAAGDAAVFAAAIILDERTPAACFEKLLSAIIAARNPRGAALWHLLRTLRRYLPLPFASFSNQQRANLTSALACHVRAYEKWPPGMQFEGGGVPNVVAYIAGHRKLRLDPAAIFTPEQLAEIAARGGAQEVRLPKPPPPNPQVPAMPDIATLSGKILENRMQDTDSILRGLSGSSDATGTSVPLNPWAWFTSRK